MINDDDLRERRFHVNADTIFQTCLVWSSPHLCSHFHSLLFVKLFWADIVLALSRSYLENTKIGLTSAVDFETTWRSKNITNPWFVRKTRECAYYWSHTVLARGQNIFFASCTRVLFKERGEGASTHNIWACIIRIYCLRMSQLWRARVLSWFVFGSGVALHAKICFLFLEKHFIRCNVCTHHGMFHCPSQPMVTVPVVRLTDPRKSKWLEWDVEAVVAAVVHCHPLLWGTWQAENSLQLSLKTFRPLYILSFFFLFVYLNSFSAYVLAVNNVYQHRLSHWGNRTGCLALTELPWDVFNYIWKLYKSELIIF